MTTDYKALAGQLQATILKTFNDASRPLAAVLVDIDPETKDFAVNTIVVVPTGLDRASGVYPTTTPMSDIAADLLARTPVGLALSGGETGADNLAVKSSDGDVE